MASEARLTSYTAIAKGDVPRRHWRRLSRAMRSSGGYRGMASWTGTMFEYLMPELFLPLTQDSLLYETAKFCVYVQKSAAAAAVRGAYPKALFTRLTRRLITDIRRTAAPGLRSSAARIQSLSLHRTPAFSPSPLTPAPPLRICVGSKSAA